MEPSDQDVFPPKDAGKFERQVRDLLEAEWGKRVHRYGRSGQEQHGVDIYQVSGDGKKYRGVQCKLHGRQVEPSTIEKELKEEIRKASKFKHRLCSFYYVTSLPRDKVIQDLVGRHNARKRKCFSVEVLFWDDILDIYDRHRDIYDRHYARRGGVGVYNEGKIFGDVKGVAGDAGTGVENRALIRGDVSGSAGDRGYGLKNQGTIAGDVSGTAAKSPRPSGSKSSN
jgi:hypothetical protein